MIKDNVLACPNCSPKKAEGDDYLHHFEMTLYRRSQEDNPTKVQNISQHKGQTFIHMESRTGQLRY